MKISEILKRVDDLASDHCYDSDFGLSQPKIKPYHHKDEDWAYHQACIEDFFGRIFLARRRTDKSKINWKRLWGIFDSFLDESYIGDEWEDQHALISYLIGLFLKAEGIDKLENKMLLKAIYFCCEETPHADDADFNERFAFSFAQAYRKKLRGLNSKLADKFESKIRRFDFFKGVKKAVL